MTSPPLTPEVEHAGEKLGLIGVIVRLSIHQRRQGFACWPLLHSGGGHLAGGGLRQAAGRFQA